MVSISQPGEGARKPESAPRIKGFSLMEAGAGERPGGAVERCWSGFSQGAEKLSQVSSSFLLFLQKPVDVRESHVSDSFRQSLTFPRPPATSFFFF